MIFVYDMNKEVGRVKLEGGKLVITQAEGTMVARLLKGMKNYAGRQMEDKELYESLPYRLQGRIWAGYRNDTREANEFASRRKAGKSWDEGSGADS